MPVRPQGLSCTSGDVTFFDGLTKPGYGPPWCPTRAVMGSTQATLTLTTLAVALHSIPASYAGDGNYNSATTTSPLSLLVGEASTSTALSSSVNPSASCQNVTFTAKVRAVSPGAGTPSGTVAFTEGARRWRR